MTFPQLQFRELYALPSRNGLMRPKAVRGNGYKMVNMGEIFAFDRISSQQMELVPLSEKEKEQFSLRKGDLLFARSSLKIEGTGKVSLVMDLSELTTFESHIIRVRLNPSIAYSPFYYYLFRSPQGRASVQSLVMQVSAAGIRASELALLSVPHPELPTQRKIAGVLSAYDDLIENNTRRIAILEEMAQAIYREWFVNFRFPGHEKVKLINSPLGEIPEGWNPQTIGSTLDFHIGGGWGQDTANDEFPNPAFVIRGTDIPEARSLRVVDCPLRFHTDSNIRTRKLRANDLVFEVSGGSKGQPVGRCLFVSERLLKRFDGDVICASFCKLIRANPAILASEILYHYLVESYTDGTIEQYEVQSTGIKNFKFTVFLESESLAVPPAQVQEAFIEHVRPILDAVHAIGKKNEVLRNTRDLLLHKLISGQLDVEELDIETGEPLVEADA